MASLSPSLMLPSLSLPLMATLPPSDDFSPSLSWLALSLINCLSLIASVPSSHGLSPSLSWLVSLSLIVCLLIIIIVVSLVLYPLLLKRILL